MMIVIVDGQYNNNACLFFSCALDLFLFHYTVDDCRYCCITLAREFSSVSDLWTFYQHFGISL